MERTVRRTTAEVAPVVRWRTPAVLVGLVATLLVVACTPPPTGGGTPTPKPPTAVAATLASAGPAPFDAHFTSEGSVDPDGSVAGYEWAFGDGTTSSEANPVKTYATPGTYAVTLTVTDDDGLTDTAETFTVTAFQPGDSGALVYFPKLSRTYGLIEDKIGVWVCKVAGSDGPDHDPAAAAAWAQSITDAYFAAAAKGRYHAEFTPLGTFEIDVPSYTQSDCLQEGRLRTDSPYTNVMVVDTTTVGGGLGGSGYVYSNGEPAALGTPPKDSARGFIVGGGSYSEFPGPDVVLHEIGHTLSFPHSYLTPTNQYDNPLDLMSGRTAGYTCSVPGFIYRCEPQHTLAFNRWAAGWLDDNQVVVHTGGTEQVDLASPESPGTELIVAPSRTSSQAIVTIEARTAVGFDKNLEKQGVAVHVEDSRQAMCETTTLGGCPGLWRRAGQAWGQPNSYDHVLTPGQSKTVHGLTITVGASVGSGYEVTVSGTANIAADALQPRPEASAAKASARTNRNGGYAIDLP